jgi:hypothetical protein
MRTLLARTLNPLWGLTISQTPRAVISTFITLPFTYLLRYQNAQLFPGVGNGMWVLVNFEAMGFPLPAATSWDMSRQPPPPIPWLDFLGGLSPAGRTGDGQPDVFAHSLGHVVHLPPHW